MALLSLQKTKGIVKGSKWHENWAEITPEGPKCPKNWDRNDYKNGAEMTWVEMTMLRNGLSLFRLITIPLKTSAASKISWEPACYSIAFEYIQAGKV